MNSDNRIILSGCIILNENKILLLHRSDHNWYETPGGKIESSECEDILNPTIEELKKTAYREAYEELGENIVLEELSYFDKAEIEIPNNRGAIAHKFLTKIISGTPRINEPKQFDKLEYIPLTELETRSLSPDLKMLKEKLINCKENLQDSLNNP